MGGIFGMIGMDHEKAPRLVGGLIFLIPMVFLLVLYVHRLRLFGQYFLRC